MGTRVYENARRKEWLKPTVLEEELLMHQMRVRQQVAEQMEAAKELFHKQYETEGLTEEDIVYDYAYSSAGHSMRMDILSVFVSTPEQSKVLLMPIHRKRFVLSMVILLTIQIVL